MKKSFFRENNFSWIRVLELWHRYLWLLQNLQWKRFLHVDDLAIGRKIWSVQSINSGTYFFLFCSFQFNFESAIRDFSIAVSLQPNNHLPFYHRACLLRKYVVVAYLKGENLVGEKWRNFGPVTKFSPTNGL